MTIAIYCDTNALWFGAKRDHNQRVDYARLRTHLIGDREVVSVSAFITDGRADTARFERALNHMGFGTTIVPYGCGVDTFLCRAASASPADTIIIASGNGQYEALFRSLHGFNKRVEFHSFPSNNVNWTQPYVTQHTLPTSVLQGQERAAS